MESESKCTCQLKCSENVSAAKRMEIRKHYQAQRTFVGKSSFIASLIEEIKVGTTRRQNVRKKVRVDYVCEGEEEDDEGGGDASGSETPTALDEKARLTLAKMKKKKKSKKVITWESHPESRKHFYRVYTLDGVKVCKPFFLDVLGISSSRCNTSLEKARVNDIQDRRGTNGGWNKIKSEKLEKVIEHIKTVSDLMQANPVPSTSGSPNKGQPKNFARHYEQYKELNPVDHVSLSSYRKVYYQYMKTKAAENENNEGRNEPKVYKCATCQSFQVTKKFSKASH